MTASTSFDTNGLLKVGLRPTHAYTLLGTATVTDKNGQECRIV